MSICKYWLIPNCTNKTFDYLLIICIQWISEELVMSTRHMIKDWVGVELTNNRHMHTSQFDKTSCVHRGLMLPQKVHQIGLKTIFKEPIFTAVKVKVQFVSQQTSQGKYVHLLEHTTVPVELPQTCWRYSTRQLLRINGCILPSIRFLICWT